MPSLENYEPLAPFSLEELVDAANSLTRDLPRPVSARTVRFYIQKGLVPPPTGSPKFARYGMEHLRRIVTIREQVESGGGLEGAAREFGVFEEPPSAPIQSRRPAAKSLRAAEHVQRYPLTPGIVLEVALDQSMSDIKRAVQAFLDDIL